MDKKRVLFISQEITPYLCETEISNKRISIAGDFFNIDELEIEKQRYFGSVTYFHNGDSHTNLDLEIGETATGLYLSLVYYDTLNNQYVFL